MVGLDLIFMLRLNMTMTYKIGLFLTIIFSLFSTVVFAELQLPKELGLVEESFQAQDGKVVYYIQDAHDSLEAQENIAQMIEHLVEKEGVQIVYEEGYEGEVPTDEFFGFIKDPEVKQKTSFTLLDQLRIGAAEYAHINRKKDFKLIGADNIKLHLENIRWYQEAYKTKDQTEKDLQELEKEIKILANRYFPNELKKWMKWKEKLDSGSLDLLNYLNRINKLGVPQNSYPNIQILLNAQKAETALELPEINAKNLFEEINQMEDALASSYLSSDRNKQIFSYFKGLKLLRKLNEILLSSAEFEVTKELLQNISTEQLADFIAKNSKKSIVLSKRWEANIKKAIYFYETAHARDDLIEEQLDDFVRSKKAEKAILVYGGFHKNAIREIFKDKNISYTIIAPKITSISKKHQTTYRNLMSQGTSDEIPLLVSEA